MSLVNISQTVENTLYSNILKSNQICKLKLKGEITDLKSERLQSYQQPEQDTKFLTKPKPSIFGKLRLRTGQKNKWKFFMPSCSGWKWCHQKSSNFFFTFFSLLNMCMTTVIYMCARNLLILLLWSFLNVISHWHRFMWIKIWVCVHMLFKFRRGKFFLGGGIIPCHLLTSCFVNEYL